MCLPCDIPPDNHTSCIPVPDTGFPRIVYVVVASGARPVIAVNVRVFAVLETIVNSLSAAVNQNPAPPVIRTLFPAN